MDLVQVIISGMDPFDRLGTGRLNEFSGTPSVSHFGACQKLNTVKKIMVIRVGELISVFFGVAYILLWCSFVG